MNYELENKLRSEFKFYGGFYGKGLPFECGDGWFNLLYNLSKGIQELIDDGIESPDFNVVQVKEKFGSLRYYSNGSVEETDKLVDEAKKLSSITCEICGKPGICRDIGGWLTTLCETCHQTNLIRLEEQYKSIEHHIKPNEDKNAKMA